MKTFRVIYEDGKVHERLGGDPLTDCVGNWKKKNSSLEEYLEKLRKNEWDVQLPGVDGYLHPYDKETCECKGIVATAEKYEGKL